MNAGSLLISLGRQWLIANLITLDVHAGLGYGISSTDYPINNSSYTSWEQSAYFENSGYRFAYYQIGNLTGACGFALGVAF